MLLEKDVKVSKPALSTKFTSTMSSSAERHSGHDMNSENFKNLLPSDQRTKGKTNCIMVFIVTNNTGTSRHILYIYSFNKRKQTCRELHLNPS